MLTASQTKFIDAIVYDKRRSPMYYAKLTQAEKYRLSHNPKNDYEIVNIQLLGIKNIHNNKGKFNETSIKQNSSTFSQIDQRFPRRIGISSVPIKKKPSTKRSQLAPKDKPSYVKDFLESETYVCVCDECSTTSFSREINSQTYTKYSPERLLIMNSQESTGHTGSAPRQPPVISGTLFSSVDGRASRSDTSYKNDHRVHTFQKFNKGTHNHIGPWQALPHKDGNAFKLKHKHEDRENPLQVDQLSAKKEVDGHSSHTESPAWESVKPPYVTSVPAKTDSHGRMGAETKPSVDDYINTYTMMSPRMNEKSTNTKENFHYLVKERFCLPNNMYESSSSPAFYTDCSKCCKQKMLSKHVCSHHHIPEDVAPSSVGDQLDQPAPPTEPEELNDFGQDLEGEEKAEDEAKRRKHKKEGRVKTFFMKLSCRQKME